MPNTGSAPKPPAPVTAPVTVTNNGAGLQLVSSTLQVTFNQAAVSALTNVATNESYISAGGAGWADLQLLQDNGESLMAGQWAMNAADGSATILLKDSQRTLSLTAGVADDEVFLKISGSSTAKGVVGATWGLSGLNLSPGRLVVPAYGGTYLDATSTPDLLGFDYPVEWENQMAVYEGKAGSLLIYARDPGPVFKRILASRPSGTLNVGFETFAPGPWPSSTSVSSIEWRLRGVSGGWMPASDVYRKYMLSLHPFLAADGARAWVKQIRGVVTFLTLDPSLLEQLAQEVVPSRTILLLIPWRQDGFDINYPDYTPDPAAPIFVARARQLGFRIMLHTNLVGVSELNPQYANFAKCQLRTPDTLTPTGWLLDQIPAPSPLRFAYISPACSDYRKLFIRSIKGAIEELQPDALHLDAGGAILNDGNGPMEGMNSIQGMMQLQKDLIAAYPNLVLGGESTNEIIGPFNWMAQRWPLPAPSHPISAYLLGGQVFYYGFLDQAHPDEQGFADYLSRYEGYGVAPVAFITTPSDLNFDATHQRTHLVLGYQKLLQEGQYSPDWTGNWSGLTFRQKSADGSSSLIVKDDGTTVSALDNSSTFYQRVHGKFSYSTPYFIDNWPAYDAERLLGTDSTQQYWLTANSYRPSGETHLLTVPTNMVIGVDTMRASQYGIFEIDGSNPNWFDFVQQLPAAAKGTIYNLKEYRVVNGAVISSGGATVGGIYYDGVIFEHPPYQLALGGSDFIEYSVPVPSAPKVTLTFDTAIADGNSQSDGVIFGVQVNQQTAWRATVLPGTGWNHGSVDLTPYVGSTVKIRLLTHPGIALNPYFDAACWKSVSINTDFSTTSALQLQVAGAGSSVAFTPNVKMTSKSGDIASITMPVPGKFSYFASAPPSLGPGASLFDTPFTTWNATGGLPSQGIYDTSGTIGSVVSGGVAKKAIAAIPPRDGQTLLTTAASLSSTAKTIALGYGLSDGPPGSGAINYSGVTFIVRANGVEVFRSTVSASGWRQQQIDISPWSGQSVVFELIADADGDQLFDYAYYTDLTIN